MLLLIEVADTSLRFDRTVKLPFHAPAGVAELWIVDLRRRAIDAYQGPAGNRYAGMMTHGAGERLALAAAPGIAVGLDVVFG